MATLWKFLLEMLKPICPLNVTHKVENNDRYNLSQQGPVNYTETHSSEE